MHVFQAMYDSSVTTGMLCFQYSKICQNINASMSYRSYREAIGEVVGLNFDIKFYLNSQVVIRYNINTNY